MIELIWVEFFLVFMFRIFLLLMGDGRKGEFLVLGFRSKINK